MLQSPAKVELTRVHYYDSGGGWDLHRNDVEDQSGVGKRPLRTISGTLEEAELGVASSKRFPKCKKLCKKERHVSPLIIKRNIFGHRWVLKINETPGGPAKKKSRTLLIVYSFVFVAIMLAFACGVYYSLFLSNRTIHSLFKKVNKTSSSSAPPFNGTTHVRDDTRFIKNLANFLFNRTIATINSNFYSVGFKGGENDDQSEDEDAKAIRNYTIIRGNQHPLQQPNTTYYNFRNIKHPLFPQTYTNNANTIQKHIPSSSSNITRNSDDTNQTTPSSTNPALPPHVCRTCNVSSERCMRTYDNPYPKCLPMLDAKDPTGCGGRCKLNTQSCKLLDRDLRMYQCLDVLTPSCPRGLWKCPNTFCITGRRRCDGRWDCRDGSDERDCECNLDTHFQCGNKTSCIEKRKRCDGVVDCWDRSDELYCSKGCLPEEISCANGQCIPKDKFCDGNIDCKDRSDEPKGC